MAPDSWRNLSLEIWTTRVTATLFFIGCFMITTSDSGDRARQSLILGALAALLLLRNEFLASALRRRCAGLAVAVQDYERLLARACR